jgi:hypothetical protein
MIEHAELGPSVEFEAVANLLVLDLLLVGPLVVLRVELEKCAVDLDREVGIALRPMPLDQLAIAILLLGRPGIAQAVQAEDLVPLSLVAGRPDKLDVDVAQNTIHVCTGRSPNTPRR